MKEPSARNLQNTSNPEIFRLVVTRPMMLFVRMTASAPVKLLLLDSEERVAYETGRGEAGSYTASWGQRCDLEAGVHVKPGTWYLVVERKGEPVRGRIELFESDISLQAG